MAATTLTQQPQDMAPVMNTIPYTLLLDVAEEGNSTTSMVYRLETVGGDVIVPLSEIPFITGGAEVDFWRDLERYTSITFPDIRSISPFEDAALVTEYVLKYGVNYTNKTTLQASPILSETSPTKKAYGGALQFKGGNLYGADGLAEVLSMRPTNNYTSKLTPDWLWILPAPNTNNIEVRITGYFEAGPQVASNSQAITTENPICFPVGPLNGFWTPTIPTQGLKWYQVEVIATGVGFGGGTPTTIATYNFYLEDTCSEDLKQVFFRETAGGFAGMAMSDTKVLTTTREGDIVKTYNRRETTPPADPGRGNSISNMKGTRQVSLLKSIPYEESAKYFLDGLITSNDIRVEETLLNGDKAIFRFIPDTGGLAHFQSDEYLFLELTGTIGPEIINLRR